jgi:hypothetical protein
LRGRVMAPPQTAGFPLGLSPGRCYPCRVQDFARALRIAGITIAVMAAAWLLWIALIGPAALFLLRPR